MSRGKESSNRIELSWLVQELLNFGVFSSLQLWGVGDGWMGVGSSWGCPPHMCTCMCMYAHACMVNMIISCKWLPPLGESLGIPYDVIRMCTFVHMCAFMCMCTCVGAPSHHHPYIHPPPIPQGGHPQNQSKFNSTWTNRDISILFEDLKSVETSPPMGGCMVWWVGQWVGG